VYAGQSATLPRPGRLRHLRGARRRYFTSPPFLCVEILSPDETVVDVRAKVREYLSFGVPTSGLWTLKLVLAKYIHRGIERVENGRFHAGETVIQLELS
jgi:hypothetical protein